MNNLRRKIRRLSSQLMREKLNAKKNKTEDAGIILKQQHELNKFRKVSNWTCFKETFSLGLGIFLKSRPAYKMLQEHLRLPSINTLKNKYKNVLSSSGLCPYILNCLKSQCTQDDR